MRPAEETVVRQCAPTLAGIKTGSLFPCPCRDEGALLDDIAAREPRVKVITRQNGGHGPALIMGLNAATGENVLILDSDRQIKDQKNLLDVDRDVRYYDFFAAFPNFLGTAYITFDEYTAQTA